MAASCLEKESNPSKHQVPQDISQSQVQLSLATNKEKSKAVVQKRATAFTGYKEPVLRLKFKI